MTSILRSASYSQEHQKLRSPVIFDESIEFTEEAALQINDELGKSDLHAALFSMSGYDKSQVPNVKNYNTNRSVQDPTYLAYAQPNLTQSHVPTSSNPHTRHQNQLPYTPSSLLEPRASFDEPLSPFSDVRSRQVPEVTSYTPQQGTQGTQIFVYFSSSYDLATVPSITYYAMFATRRCQSELTRLDLDGPYYSYVLRTEAPSHTATGWANPQVPLRLLAQDGSGLDSQSVNIGPYTYTDTLCRPRRTSPTMESRKRKFSVESAECLRMPVKRSSNQQLRPNCEETFDVQAYSQQPNSAYLQQQPTFSTDSSFGSLMPYERSPNQAFYQQQGSPRRVSQHLSTSSASSRSQLRGPSPQTPSWSSSNPIIHQSSRSPNLSGTAMSRMSSISSPSNTKHPPLIRTSTLQQPSSPIPVPSGPSTNVPFNPYKMPHKAVLKIDGDLDTMVEDWSETEFEAKRRLVQFWRSQSGNEINTNFKPVAPDDRQPNSICVSCIWWEAKQECYVTSVDTISLLESLVAVRFTVEEKNRIRRNLEGFRPMTVSKGKSDSEDFFKVIMGFPNPKPRNIEKDVKVFPWKILSHALKKIIGKYSASYSSTAGELHNPVGSSYGGAAQPDTSTELLPIASPHSASSAISCSAYTTALTSMISPDVSHSRLSVPYSSAGPSMLQLSGTILPNTYATSPLLYPYQAQTQMSVSGADMQLIPQPNRGSWDFPTFMGTSAPTAASNAQTLYYQRGLPNVASSQEASIGQYQMTHTSSGQ